MEESDIGELEEDSLKIDWANIGAEDTAFITKAKWSNIVSIKLGNYHNHCLSIVPRFICVSDAI